MIDTALPMLKIRDFELLPIVQGGMGVGISAHRLAGAVAKENAVGTIASVELRRLHPDLMARTGKCQDTQAIREANLEALGREIDAAREISGTGKFIAVNVMKALSNHVELVKQACEKGANAIVMGAGLPLDLMDITKKYQDVALIPILSDARGVGVILKKWIKKGRLPDAIVIENPKFAGGHLGAGSAADIDQPKFDFKSAIDGALQVFEKLKIKPEQIPLIPAGGINSFAKLRDLISVGASGGQLGTPFAVTKESDADDAFKQVLLDAKQDDMVVFTSAAGLPARAVLTPWLKKYLSREPQLMARATPECGRCPRKVECLTHCGFKDGNSQAGQFCIENQLAAAQRGDVKKGLFFRGSEPLPFGKELRSVRELLEYMLLEPIAELKSA